MPCLVLLCLCARTEAATAKIKVFASSGAPNANRQGNVRLAYIAMVLYTRLSSCECGKEGERKEGEMLWVSAERV